MGYQKVEGIRFMVGADTQSATTRLERGAKVKAQGTASPLYQQPDIKTGVDNVAADSATLKTLVDNFSAAKAALKKAGTALATGLRNWDRSYKFLVAAGEKQCTTADEGTSLGLSVRGTKKNALAMPLAVDVTQDLKKKLVRIHVTRAPGMRAVVVQTSTDPSNPASWQELVGHGAVHTIPNPPPGTLHVRAASKTARAQSDFTTPVSIVVT
jgi:hypothetical protein